MKNLDFDNALNKLVAYCAKAERCISQVKTKLFQLGISDENQINKIIDYLIKYRFLDEERFAKAFAKDKYNINKWGKIKIKQELSIRHISNNNINIALNEIDDDDNDENTYKEKLKTIISQKKTSLEKQTTNKRVIYQKLFRFAASKGYEFDLIKEILDKTIVSNDDMFEE